MVERTRVIKRFKSFILGKCRCGCNEDISIKLGSYLKKYVNAGHRKKGEKFPPWKYKIRMRDDYRYLYMPDYHRVKYRGCIAEHIYFYESYHKLCMLPWGDVHHIDPVRKGYCNNMIWNLEGMMHSQHAKISHFKDKSSRFCLLCGKKTRKNKKGYEYWSTYKDGFICQRCHDKRRLRSKKQKLAAQTQITAY